MVMSIPPIHPLLWGFRAMAYKLIFVPSTLVNDFVYSFQLQLSPAQKSHTIPMTYPTHQKYCCFQVAPYYDIIFASPDLLCAGLLFAIFKTVLLIVSSCSAFKPQECK